MSLATPSTQDIASNITSQLQASLSQSIPFLPKAFLLVLAKVLAGVFVLLYKYAGFSLLQLFVATASTKETTVNGRTFIPLVEWGVLVGVGRPNAATRAILSATVTVTEQTGDLANGAQLIRSTTGVVYVSTQPVELDAATVEVTIRAASDPQGNGGIGTIGNLQEGDELSFASPLPNVARVVTVSEVIETAEDAEDWETYRSRVVERMQARPQGGAYADYRIWARTVPGIVAAYPYTGNPGQVDVYIEASVESSESEDGIPTEAQITAVEEAIDLDEDGIAYRRPVNAAVNVFPITRTEFDITIENLAATDLASLEDDIEAGVDEYLRAREPFIVGLSVLPRLDRVTQPALSGVVEGIVSAAGGTFTSLVLELSAVEIQAYSLDTGEKAKLGTVSYVSDI
jgi:uncharacterized phage protein gp47/JayE